MRVEHADFVAAGVAFEIASAHSQSSTPSKSGLRFGASRSRRAEIRLSTSSWLWRAARTPSPRVWACAGGSPPSASNALRARAASLARQMSSPKRLVLRTRGNLSSGARHTLGCFAAGRAALGNRCLGAAVVKIDANRNCCDSHLSPRTHACSIAAPASVLSQTIDTLALGGVAQTCARPPR